MPTVGLLISKHIKIKIAINLALLCLQLLVSDW